MRNDILIEKLRIIMKEKGLSPEAASFFIGVSFKTIYRWLNYESRPSKLARKAIKNGLRRIGRIGK